MIIYELTNEGHEKVEDCLPKMAFQEDKVFRTVKNNHELKLEYEFDNMPFSINRSHFSILLQDIHNERPCGTLFVSLPLDEGFDTITYTVRFSEREFEVLKKFA